MQPSSPIGRTSALACGVQFGSDELRKPTSAHLARYARPVRQAVKRGHASPAPQEGAQFVATTVDRRPSQLLGRSALANLSVAALYEKAIER